MKAVDLSGGPWGRRKWLVVATAAAAVLVLAGIILIGGCGGNEEQGTAGSQLDDEASDSVTVSTVSGAGDNVLPGYTEEQCIDEMTARYGDEETARQVCDAIRSDYGDSSLDFETILQDTEARLGVAPLPGAPAPAGPAGQPGGNQPGGSQPDGSRPGGSQLPGPPPQDPPPGDGGGWDSGGIEIIVPPAP
ncbi:MAG: hypothetical protein IBX61_02705 [Thermoleophilia bacterium]|nr:hypothetical protein [Thermoleophilia bacterium]